MKTNFLLRLKHVILLPMLFLLLMAMSMVGMAQTVTSTTTVAKVWTDKSDYAPGETVTITGTGFVPGEGVVLLIEHIEPNMPNPLHLHAAWGVIADNEGNFTSTWYVDAIELNTTLFLTADGDLGSYAETTFTDGVFTYLSGTFTVTGATNWSELDRDNATSGIQQPISTDAIIVNNDATLTVNVNNAVCSSSGLGLNTNNKEGTLTFNAGSQVTISGVVTFASSNGTQNIIMTSGGKLICQGFSGTNITFTPGTGTVELTANNTLPASNLTSFSNLIVSSGTTTLGIALTISGNVTINEGATLDESTRQMTLNSGSFLTVNGTLDFSSSTGLIRTGNNVNATLTMGLNGVIRTADDSGVGPGAGASLQTQGTGTWATTSISSTGTVEYNRSSAQAITDRDYNNLIITNTGTKTWALGATRIINGNLTINASAPLTLTGTQTLNVKGNWTNNGSFTKGTETVAFNGGTTQTIGGTANTTFNNLSIASGTIINPGGRSHTAANLTLGNAGTASGTWGSTGSGAAHINNTYFTGTGTVNVTNDTRPTPAFSNLTASQTISYGTSTVSLSGTVSAAGPVYAADGKTVNVTINGSTQNATIAGGSGGFTINFPTATIPYSASAYTITYAYVGDDNLKAAANNISTALTVNKAASTITTTGITTYTYSGIAQGPATSTVLGSSGAITYSYSGTGSTTYPSSSTRPTNAGTYQVIASVAVDANYNGASSAPLAFTIGKAVLTATADDKTKVYGAANPTLTFQYSGWVNGVEAIDVAPAITTLLDGTTIVGTYADAITLSGGSDNNYTFNLVAGDMEVTARPITITANMGQTKVYGNTDPSALTYTVSGDGLATGDVFAGVLQRVAGETVNTYAINRGTLAIVAGAVNKESNYTLTYVSNTFSITARPITITANTGQTKVYGNADPLPFLYTVSGDGLAAGDVFAGVLQRVTGETVNTYAINRGTLAIVAGAVNKEINYTITYVSNTFSITARPVSTSVAVSPNSVHYSDQVIFTATITGGYIGGIKAAETVTFKVGTQTMNTTPIALGISGSNLTATLTTELLETIAGTMAPGGKTVYAVFNLPNSNYTVSPNPATNTLTITKEDARVDYTGDVMRATATTTTYSATVTLQANIFDISATSEAGLDTYPGDIRNARVMFVDRDASDAPISGWIPVSTLVNSADSRIGTVSYPYNVTGLSSTTPYKFITVGIIVNNAGYYIRNSANDNVVVTVYTPVGDFITGGGYIVPTQSVGTMKSDPGSKVNFGFNVKFKKGGTNLGGNMNIIFRRTESDNKVHTYQIKANAMQSLGVNATNLSSQTAEYVSKTNLTDITNPLAPVSKGGNLYLYVKMTDKGEPGSNDNISFALVSGTVDPTILSNIIYSSNWVNSKTDLLTLSGGNLVVHSGFNVTSTAIAATKSAEITTAVAPVIQTIEPTLKAYPNPFTDRLNIEFSSANDTQAKLEIYSVTGAKLATLFNGPVETGVVYFAEYMPHLVSSQMVFYHLTMNGKTQVCKVIYNKR